MMSSFDQFDLSLFLIHFAESLIVVSLNSDFIHSGRTFPVMTLQREETLRPRIIKKSAQSIFFFINEVSFTNVSVVYIHSVLACQLFEELSRENGNLQSQLQDTQRIVSQTRLDLEKATQVTMHPP